jgi:hypothetical protein
MMGTMGDGEGVVLAEVGAGGMGAVGTGAVRVPVGCARRPPRPRERRGRRTSARLHLHAVAELRRLPASSLGGVDGSGQLRCRPLAPVACPC